MKTNTVFIFSGCLAVLLCLATGASAANVGPSGYTNDFSAQPATADWATLSITGAAGNAYSMTTEMNSNALMTASSVTAQCGSAAGTPPNQLAAAVWNSTGQNLQTRPTGNKYTALMGKFVNTSGTNATQLTISYTMTFAGTVIAEQAGYGTQVFYSLTGETNSWINLAKLNTEATAGPLSFSTNLTLNWTNGAVLYLVFADDNSSSGGMTADTANQYDNFSLAVSAGTLPGGTSVALTAPANNATFNLAVVSSIALAATATNTSASVTNVEFYQGTTLLGEDTALPFAFNWSGLVTGSYALRAVAFDDTGVRTTSAPVNITVLSNYFPTVTLTNPANNASFVSPASVTMQAATTDGAGTVTNVDFYGNNVVVGSDTNGPFSYVWTGASLGSNQLYAVAKDNAGLIVTSAPVNITVVIAGNLVGPAGYTNEFLTPPAATDWATLSITGGSGDTFSFDNEVNTNALIVASSITTQCASSNASPPASAVLAVWSSTGGYLQTRPGGNKYTALLGKFVNTSGTNATQVGFSYQMTFAGTVVSEESGYGTRAYYSLTGETNSWINLPSFNTEATAGPLSFSTNLTLGWTNGANFYLLLVDDNSSSGNFGATDTANQYDNFYFGVTAGTLPGGTSVALTAPANNAVFNLAAVSSIALAVTATNISASVTNVEFYQGTTLLGQDTTLPFDFNWSGIATGAYVLRAVAVDTVGGGVRTTSAPVSITVLSNYFPTVTLTNPVNNASFVSPASVTMQAVTIDGLGTVTNVEFYGNNSSLNSDSASPYSYVWTGASFGSNQLYAVAKDNAGLIVTSAPVNITVTIAGNLVGTAGYTNGFGSQPAATEWATLSIVGAQGNSYAFTNEVSTNTSLTLASFTVAPTSTASDPPATSGTATYSSAGDYLQTRPTGNKYTALMGKFVNTSGTNATQVTISYDEDIATAGDEDAEGTQVFYSFTGLTNSWTNLAAFNTTSGSIGSRTASTNLTLNWTNGGNLYLLWVDDNSSGTADVAYQIDNFSMSVSAGTPAGGTSVALTAPADGAVVSLVATSSITLTATAYAVGATVTNVEFFQGSTKLGEDTTAAPYEYVWSSLSIGAYILRAVAVDDTGLRVTSAPVAITIVANFLPTVALTNPADGSIFSVLSNITIGASAADSDGTIAKVEFYQGTNKLGEDLTGPVYSYVWSGMAVGSYSLTAVATDSNGGSTTSAPPVSVSVVANFPPTVSITSPSGGASFLFGASVTIDASAADTDGTVTNVNFYDGAAFLGSDAVFPYSLSTASLALGSHSLKAVAFDNLGATNTSATVTITIFANVKPTVTLTNPLANGIFSVYSNLTLGASAADSDGTIAKVEFYQSTTKLGEDTTGPVYSYVWSGMALGSYSLTAVATDNNGGVTTSSPPVSVSFVTNVLPTVSITSPIIGAGFMVGASVTINATAADADGSVTNVDIYDGATRLVRDTLSPYNHTIVSLTSGSHPLTAVAFDNVGGVSTSSIVTIYGAGTTLTRGPYLLNGTTNTALVRWCTSSATGGYVRYGTDINNLNLSAFEAISKTNHIVQLTNLEPNTTYYYSVGTSGETIAARTNFFLVTPPHVGTPQLTRMWVLGDAGGGNATQYAVRDAYNTYAATNGRADLILMLGDNAYSTGTDAEFQTTLFNVYTNNLCNSFTYAAVGNHDTAHATSTDQTIPMFNWFTSPKNGEVGGLPSGNNRYFSFDHANIHFVVLDSMAATYQDFTVPSNPMFNWLTNDLASTLQPWLIVFFHHPPYTHGSHNSDTESDLIMIREQWTPVLESYGVDLVLNGHSHVYERSYLVQGHTGSRATFTTNMVVVGGSGDPTGTGAYQKLGATGTVYTVTGKAGGQSGSILSQMPVMYAANAIAGSSVIEVTDNRLEAIYLTSAGNIVDRFSIIKPVAPSAPTTLIATAVASNQIQLSWTDNAINEFGFGLERGTNGVNFAPVASLGSNVLNHLDSGLLAGTTYYYRVRATNNVQSSDYSNIASATTFDPPVIVTQPNNRTNNIGSTANFSVTANGASLAYQWRFNGIDLAGKTGSGLALNNVQNSNAGPYTVRITNSYGAVTSIIATLTINNHAPTAADSTASTVMNQPLVIDTAKLLTTASDLDGDVLSISAVTSPSANGGVVVLGVSTITYTPSNNYVGADLFSYTVSDGYGGTTNVSVLVQVTTGSASGNNMLPLAVVSNGILVRFAGIPGRTYSLQRTLLAPISWTNLSPVLTAPSGIGQYTDTNPPSGGGFYRTLYP